MAEPESRAPFSFLEAQAEAEIATHLLAGEPVAREELPHLRGGHVDRRWPDGLVHRSVFEGTKLKPRDLYEVVYDGGFQRPLTSILMSAVVYAESGAWTEAQLLYGSDPDEFIPSDPLRFDCGLGQVSQIHGHTLDELKDPLYNLRACHAIFERRARQFTAWMAYVGGYHLKHLRKATKGLANYHAWELDFDPFI
jgi:hypothetical protein